MAYTSAIQENTNLRTIKGEKADPGPS